MNLETRTFNRRTESAVGVLVYLVSLIVYLRTVAPTTSMWDCGEFIACSKILGVMHPPGAPLYLLIGKIMTMLPLAEDIGLRVNLFSIFISTLTVLLTYLIIIQLIKKWRGQAKNWEDRLILYTSGAFGALGFAFTDSFWFNAVEAEVYAFSMFFTALVVWLALYWEERAKEKSSLGIICLIFYLFGLAVGVHLLNLLAFPFILLISLSHDNHTVKRLLVLIFFQFTVPLFLYVLFFQFNPEHMSYSAILNHQAKAQNFIKWFGSIWILLSLIYVYAKDRKLLSIWCVITVLTILGFSTYMVIYIRAGLSPPINLNNPSTFKGITDYLARKQYGTEDLLLTFMYRKADFWHYQIQQMFNRYFGWQFIGKGTTFDYHDRIVEIISFRGLYGIPFFVGLWGAIHHYFMDRKRTSAVFALFLLTGYAIIIYVNQPDPQPRERDYSYVGAFFAFSLWIGIGIAGIFDWISVLLKRKLYLKNVSYIAAGILLFLSVPWNLYSFNHHSHSRWGNYIAYDYSYNILETCEPDSIIFTNGDNDTFPLWFLQEVCNIRKDVRVINLSLLNTPWFIKQLRDQNPLVPIHLSDRTINNLTPIAWETNKVKIPVTQEVLDQLQQEIDNPEKDQFSDNITFTLKPTFEIGNVQGLRVQDLMVLHIINAAQWKRPVYFAVTVPHKNMIGLDPYLRMDGLAYKVLPYLVDTRINPQKLRENLLNKYQYRGIDDPRVYYDRTTINMLQNYRSSFGELARYYIDHFQKEQAAFILDEMSKKIPADHVPYVNEKMAMFIASLYKMAGRFPEAENQIQHLIPGINLSRQDWIDLASYYIRTQEWDLAEGIFEQLIEKNPNDGKIYSYLLYMYKLSSQYNKALNLLENWIIKHPADTNAKREITELKKILALKIEKKNKEFSMIKNK